MSPLRYKLRFIAFWIVFMEHFGVGNSAGTFSIGAMLSSPEIESVFQNAVREINENSSSVLKAAKLNATSHVISPNPIRSALDVCDKVVSEGVYVVIVSHPNGSHESPPLSVSYACGFYNIPVIGLSARDSIFSDKVNNKNEYNFSLFLRTGRTV